VKERGVLNPRRLPPPTNDIARLDEVLEQGPTAAVAQLARSLGAEKLGQRSCEPLVGRFRKIVTAGASN
jgi:hypothetical protein